MQHPFIIDHSGDGKIPLVKEGNLNINEYLLIIQPHEDLYNKVMSLKKSFAEKYDCPLAMYTKSHITLVNFVQWEMREQSLLQRMKNLIECSNPFQVSIDGFGSLPSHTIYMNIQTKSNITELVKSLRPIQSLMTLSKDHKPHFILEPHLTIARKLKPWQYEKAWLDYSHLNFTANFGVNKAILLRRQVDTKKYFQIASFPLMNKPSDSHTQASLFS